MSQRTSRRAVSVALLPFLYLLLALTAQTVLAQTRVAILTDVKGSVEISRADSQSFDAAEWGTQLYEGDRIRTGEDGSTSLLFSSGNMLALEAGSSLTVSAQANETPVMSGPVKELDGELLAVASDVMVHRAGEGEVAVLGGLRGTGDSGSLRTLYPVNTRILGHHPTFSWDAQDDFDGYRVEIRTAAGPVWSSETDGTSVEYPESAPALEPGTTYFWQVSAETMLDMAESPLVSFQIVDESTAGEIQAKLSQIESLFEGRERSSEYHYILGSFYAGQGLFGDAVTSFSWIAEQNPGSASAHRILGDLYSEIGMKDEAIRALQTAVSLSDRQ